MKKILIISLFLTSCVGYNDILTERWIDKNKKPIAVQQYGFGEFNAYELLSADSVDFNTGLVKMILNDTIK